MNSKPESELSVSRLFAISRTVSGYVVGIDINVAGAEGASGGRSLSASDVRWFGGVDGNVYGRGRQVPT